MPVPRVETVLDANRLAQMGRPGDEVALHELLTVEDVAILLKVSKSWVYEHTRNRRLPQAERLPFVKIGKYVRFDPRAVAQFLARRSRIA